MARRKRVKTREADVFQRTFMGVFERLSGAGALLTAALVGLLLLLALMWGFASWREQAGDRAWREVARVLEERDAEKQLKLMEGCLQKVAGTRAHPVMMQVLAAQLHEKALKQSKVREEDRAKFLKRARKLSEEFLEKYPRHTLAVKARGRLAMVLEDSGEADRALTAFEEAARACRDTGFAFLEGKLLWGQARCAKELGRKEKALLLLERALAKDRSGRRSGWAAAAAHLRDVLRKPRKELIVKGAERDQPAEKPPEEEKEEDKDGGKPSGAEG